MTFLVSLRYSLCSLLLCCFGYLFPALNTIRAVLSVGTDENDDEIAEWLTYWVVLGVFYLLEVVCDLFMWHVPLYLEGKVVLVCWLTFPRSQGEYFTFPCTYLMNRRCILHIHAYNSALLQYPRRKYRRIHRSLSLIYLFAALVNCIISIVPSCVENATYECRVGYFAVVH